MLIRNLMASLCDGDAREEFCDELTLVIKALALAAGQEGYEWPSRPTGGVIPDEYLDKVCFRAFVAMIDSNSGVGFYNQDQGHPSYALGRGGTIDPVMGGDSPEANCLFGLLQRFPDEYHEQVQDLRTWEQFCAFAVAAFDRHEGR